MKKTICLSLVLIAVLALSGCSLYGSSQTSAPRAAPAATPPTTVNNDSGAVNPAVTPPAATNNNSDTVNPVATPPATTNNDSGAINIENFAFNPSTITIKKGAAITWTNNDSAPHQIKSTTFNSGVLSKGQSFSFTFNEAGTFNYSCSIHPSMTGQIIVE